MESADDLVRQYVRVRPWPNTDKPRSALGMPVVLDAIEKLLPTLHMAIWGSGKDPFLVMPVGKTKPEAARAWQNLLRWAVRKADLKEGSRLTLKNIVTYGFGVGTYGWKTEEIKKRKYRMTADGQGVERDPDAKSEFIARPDFECANLRNIIIDPNCSTQDARKGKFFCKRIVITAYELDDLRNDDTYKNIPTEEELRTILANKQEPTEDSMQALKRQPDQRISGTKRHSTKQQRPSSSTIGVVGVLECRPYRHGASAQDCHSQRREQDGQAAYRLLCVYGCAE